MTYLFIGLLGLAVGSFVNVVIWRVPRGESLVSPSSSCPKCADQIKVYDNIPVLSWLLLRGKCRACKAGISLRYPIIELLVGLAFIATFFWLGENWQLPAFLYLATIGITLGVIDLEVHKLPNKIVLPSYAVVPVLLVIPSAAYDQWPNLVRALLAGAVLYVIYFLIMFAYPAGIGFGDVKLAGVLGMYLGWFSWGSLAIGGFAAFLLGGIAALGLMAGKKANRKSGIPLGPFMFLGTYVGLVWGEAIWNQYLTMVGL